MTVSFGALTSGPPMASTSEFLATVGVDTHIPYTDGRYVDIATVIANLDYLGITQVRDGITDGEKGSAPLSSYIALAQHGIKFTFVISTSGSMTRADLDHQVGLIARVATAVPGSVIAVEGANEINNWPVTYNGVGGIEGALNLQREIYAKVHADPALAGVAVDYFTGYAAGDVPVGPDPFATGGLADYDTQHPYIPHGRAPAPYLDPAKTLPNISSVHAGPYVYTETGYTTESGMAGAVNQDVQAKYTLDLLFDTFKYGVSKTYIYQLMDAYRTGSRQGNDGYGLFDQNGVAKSAAFGLHNLTNILSDPGAAGTAPAGHAPDIAIRGLPADGNSLVLAKSGGVHDLVLWREPPLWDEARAMQLPALSATISLTLDGTYGTVKVYDPLVGSSPISVLYGVRALDVAVTDHPIIVELSSHVAAPAAVTGQSLFGTLTHAASSAGGQVYALYDGLLGRAPDALGLAYWADRFADGVAPATLAATFLASAEGQARSGAADAATFVAQLYDATLHRKADASGLHYWTGQLNAGMSRAEIGVGFALSPEHLAHIQPALDAGLFVPDADAAAVARVYYTMLSRAPDAAGLKFWTDAVKTGTPLAVETQAFLNLPEAQAKVAGLSTAQYVDLVYTNALGRHAEADGLAFWTHAIDSHLASRVDVTTQIGQSAEAQIHLAPLIEQGWHLA